MHPPQIVILKADRLHADLLRKAAVSFHADARCHVVSHLQQAREQLEISEVDLFMTGIDSSEGDLLGFLAEHTRQPRRARNIFIVTARREPRILALLWTLPINGVFDSSSEDSDNLATALQVVFTGKAYWSSSVVQRIMRDSAAPGSVAKLLTPFEQRVFATIGDGSDNDTAAERLGVKSSTISSTRKVIHRKLCVRHRGELVREAILSGYVCFSSGEILRPGFSLL